jgi:MFS transporter, OFA family, oxalate/formate antiporter
LGGDRFTISGALAMASIFPVPWPTLKMLLAVGLLYLIMMGSTFSSLGVVLPHMIRSLGMNFGEAGFGFTLLALAAGTSSLLPAMVIKRWNGRTTLFIGVIAMFLAYVTMALCYAVPVYYAGAVLLGIGFSLIGAVPGLHVLSGWTDENRSIVFGAYLAMGGLGGALWPTVVETAIGQFGGWRGYWWFMGALIAVVGALCLSVVRERASAEETATGDAGLSWTLGEALRTPQFYIIGLGIAATYLVASTVNAFTVSYLTKIGISTAIAVIAFSVQSAGHSAFPLIMGGIARRTGVRALLVFGLVIQAIGMLALAVASSLPTLIVFAIGVGGGYGTIFLATTLSLQEYFGRRHYAHIFGANQLFTTISVVGPWIIGWVADLTGRFDISFAGCAVMLLATAAAAMTLRSPRRRPALVPVATS